MNEFIAQIDESVVAININQTYRDGISASELYDCTRGTWRLDRDRAENARFAFAVYRGVVKEVYEINQWHQELSTEYKSRQPKQTKLKNRFEFVGKVAQDDIRDKYIGKQMPEMHGQNPIRYYNC
jgi:hypothetical protein